MDAPWFRFSLRGLFAAVTCFCLLFGYVGFELDWARQRERFLQADAPTRFHRLGFAAIHTLPRGPMLSFVSAEKHYHCIEVPVQLSREDLLNNQNKAVENHPDIRLAKKLFPESGIQPLIVPEASAGGAPGAFFHERLSSQHDFDAKSSLMGALLRYVKSRG